MHTPSLSFGIALYPEHAKKPSELAMKAEKALSIARAHGGGGCEMYQHGTAAKTLERILLENELRKSVHLGHLHLDYQPKVNLKTGELIGVEALVRWNHPDLGRIPPDKFIPVAEETKIIYLLGNGYCVRLAGRRKNGKIVGIGRFVLLLICPLYNWKNQLS